MDEKLPSYRDIDIGNDEDLSQFCFESDHPELKTNTDYLKLMKELYVLELYRSEVIQAIEVNNELKIQKENNPDEYSRRVINGETQSMFNLAEDFPNPIPEEKRHEIDWSKYDMIKCEDGIIRCIDDIKTPPSSLLPSSFKNIKVEPSESVHSNPGSDDDKIMVRGRKFDESKPETFNQLWTDEEQTRLEQLLLEYPPERFENRRWAKIAKALGNRTPKQVCSRVQKYFVKLHKAGLSIPGRAPRTRNGNLRKSTKLKKNHHLPTTFFPNIKIESAEHSKTIDDVKVEPNNDDHDESIDSLDYEIKPKLEIFENVSYPSPNDSEVTVMDCDETLTEIKTESKEFECEDEESDLKSKIYESKLDVLLAIKENKSSPERGYHHYHFKCCFCDEVIVGLRWNCRTCDIYVCSDCVLDMINSKFENCHPEKHPLVILGALDKDLYDYDYYPGNFKSTNHLDPNYRPVEDN